MPVLPLRSPLIYLDSNVLSDIANNALSAADILGICDCNRARFAFSEYSVYEAIKGNAFERICARALVIDSLASVWIPDNLWQRDVGFIRFLTSEPDGAATNIPLFGSFSALLKSKPTLSGLTIHPNHSAAHEACLKIAGKSDESILEKSMEGLEEVRKALKQENQSVPSAQINLILARSVLERYGLPVADSGTLLIKVAMGGAMLNRICPALEIETLLGDFRASDALKANASNSYDFFHLATCLPVCDFFVSQDKDAVKAAQHLAATSQHRIAKAINPNSSP